MCLVKRSKMTGQRVKCWYNILQKKSIIQCSILSNQLKIAKKDCFTWNLCILSIILTDIVYWVLCHSSCIACTVISCECFVLLHMEHYFYGTWLCRALQIKAQVYFIFRGLPQTLPVMTTTSCGQCADHHDHGRPKYTLGFGHSRCSIPVRMPS